MKKLEQNLKYIPFVVYLGFFLMQIIIGIILIAGGYPSNPFGLIDPPVYQPLSYLDLLILLAMNIPTFIIIGFAIKKIQDKKES